MTKKFWLIALIVACTVVFGSCDKSEELSVEQCKLDMNLFNQTYTVNDEGCCVLKGRKPIAAEEIQSKVKGYGWESIATYEVQENGKLSKEEFWKDRFGGSPTHFWFETSQQAFSYFYSDALPAFCFSRVSWTYDMDKGFILFGSNKQTTDSRYMQILKLDESNGKTLMYTIQKLGATSDGSNGYKSIYGMIVYKRMTETDLEMMKKSYTYDTDIDRSVPDNCKFKIKAYYAEDDKDNTDPVFQTFCLVTFELTDEYGFNSSDNAYYNYYDSITWTSDCRDMPDSFGIMERKTKGVSDRVRRASIDYYIRQLQPGGDWAEYHNIVLSVRSLDEALRYWNSGIRQVMFCVEISSRADFEAYDASPIPWRYIMAYIRTAVDPRLQEVYDLLHARGVMTMTSIVETSDKVKNARDRNTAYLRELLAEPDIIETDYPSEFVELPRSRREIHALQDCALRSRSRK